MISPIPCCPSQKLRSLQAPLHQRPRGRGTPDDGLMTATTYSPLYWPLFCIGTCWLITPSICHQAINLSSSKQSAQKMDKPCTWGSPRCRSSFLTKPPPRSTKHVSWLPTTGWSEEHHSRRSSSSCCWIEIIIYQTLLGENYLRRPFLSNTTIQNDK